MDGLQNHGQRAPRSFAAAIALTLAMPGLGHVYCGELLLGLRLWMGAFLVLSVSAAAWVYWLFVPWLPLALLGTVYALYLGWLFVDLAERIERLGPAYVPGPMNHVPVYLMLFCGLWAGPFLLGQSVVRAARVAAVEIDDEAMFPKLLEGDIVLVDRLAFSRTPPVEGDLVVVQRPEERPRIARVVATAGRSVQLREGHPVVDGEPLAWEPLEALRVPNFGEGPLALTLASLTGYLERALEGGSYVVTYSGRAPRGPEPALVATGHIFVMSDNRGAADDSALFAQLPLEVVLGRPRYVWASVSTDGESRGSRVGVEVE